LGRKKDDCNEIAPDCRIPASFGKIAKNSMPQPPISALCLECAAIMGDVLFGMAECDFGL
jgi:hypothetical protein